MIVAIDKQVDRKKLKKEYEYIYVFDDDETTEDLVATNLKCINKDYIKYVDINLSQYDIKCIKKANIEDKKWYDIPPIKEHKIAIIVPNYNYEHTLNKCFDSILSQRYKNFEIIYVDDCSTDNSVKIAKEYQKKDNRIKVVQLKQKRLNGGARNEGYLHISDDVDYIWYVDSDDWLIDEDVLSKINYNLRNEPDVLFVGLAKYDGKKITEGERTPNYVDKYDAATGWSGSSGKVIKKDLAIRQECLYDEGTLKEDRNQHYKICMNMKSFEILEDSVYVWNQSNTKSVTTIREQATWGTSTIRQYADTLKLYLTYKGRDARFDRLLKERVEKTKNEMNNGGDLQW